MMAETESRDVQVEAGLKWIDTVEIKYAWPGKLVMRKGDKRKGQLVIGEDGAAGFVTGNEKVYVNLDKMFNNLI